MTIRPIGERGTDSFFRMLCRLDEETEYMMYEPGERQARAGGSSRLRDTVRAAQAGGDLLLAAADRNDEIVGFLWAERGKTNRVRHTAYIVVGILEAYRGQGLGTEFFRRLDSWAAAGGVTRLELTVECENTAAVRLYEKFGFAVEGVRVKSMMVGGQSVDEFYMGKTTP